MAVNIQPPKAEDLLSITGVSLGIAQAHVRKPNRKDLLVISLEEGCRVAGVFTRNRFAAAPVIVCKQHLADRDPIRAIVVNTGVANAGTGQDGLARARETCAAVASLLDVENSQVLPLSTGVIMEPLPVDRIKAGLPQAHSDLSAGNWASAAEAIMTTDTVPKAVSRQTVIDGRTVTVTGISKGAGMIEPNMATMLGLIATDAAVGKDALRYLARLASDRSFNAISVDGDTSTNDTVAVLANGASGVKPSAKAFEAALTSVLESLAQQIARDGEGARKLITIDVEGAANEKAAAKIARSIANSPLVKTAIAGSDPNLGRILAAVGNAGVADLDPSSVGLQIGDVTVVERGGRSTAYTEEQGKRVMKPAEIAMTVTLGRGVETATVWTCDFSYDYVKINADYRS